MKIDKQLLFQKSKKLFNRTLNSFYFIVILVKKFPNFLILLHSIDMERKFFSDI